MKLESLHDLFIHLLQDAQSAEKQLSEALPELAASASNSELRQTFESHLSETRSHLNLIADLLESFHSQGEPIKCAAMAGIIREGGDFLNDDIDPRVRDAALIAAAQRAEHYEIAAYGTLVAYADVMGHSAAKEVLEGILEQEKTADENLSALSDTINPSAVNRDAMDRTAARN